MDFPILCVDDFYTNPDEVREFALSQEFNCKKGNFPGKRTKELHLINETFFGTFCSRLFSIFYQFERESVSWVVESYFQKTYPYDEDPNSIFNEGWIHVDSDQCICAGVIYLNPSSNLNAGTTFYLDKNSFIHRNYSANQVNWTPRNDLYAGKEVDKFKYVEEKLRCNDLYEKTLEINNVYNRLAFYGSQYPHRETNFCASDTEPRLTQVFFVKNFESLATPLGRTSNYEISF